MTDRYLQPKSQGVPVADPVVFGLNDGYDARSADDMSTRIRNAVSTTNEHLANEAHNVHEQWRNEGAVAAARHAATTTFGRATSVAASVIPETAVLSSALELASVATSRASVLAKPYIEKVLEHPSVERIVGSVREATVGAGTMVVTRTKLVAEHLDATAEVTRGKFVALWSRSPEVDAAEKAEAEAWRQVLSGDGWALNNSSPGSNPIPKCSPSGGVGQELVVPARTAATSSFVVPAGALLQWRFRVAAQDLGFALRVRMQGDGGATEVDVFSVQRYASGVTVQGAWSPTVDSQLIMVWDNTYSYLREKMVAFQTAVHRPEDTKES